MIVRPAHLGELDTQPPRYKFCIAEKLRLPNNSLLEALLIDFPGVDVITFSMDPDGMYGRYPEVSS